MDPGASLSALQAPQVFLETHETSSMWFRTPSSFIGSQIPHHIVLLFSITSFLALIDFHGHWNFNPV